eukprot:COSAG05_NODE_13037_length_444_cov_0.602899_1_plen_120_part_01
MNPIPDVRMDALYFRDNVYGNASTANITEYEPPCTGLAKEGQGYLSLTNPEQNKLCAGQPTGVQIVDRVVLPSNLPAGDYVLGWVRSQRSPPFAVATLLLSVAFGDTLSHSQPLPMSPI